MSTLQELLIIKFTKNHTVLDPSRELQLLEYASQLSQE